MAEVKTNLPLVDLARQYETIKPAIQEALEQILHQTNFIMGKEISEFEEAFAAFTHAKHAIGVASGTAAIHLVLCALGVTSGDEVITVPNSFIATVEPIYWLGAKPVFVDIHPEYFTLDPDKLEAAITPRTKAIMPVHLYGQCAQMDAIHEIASRYGIPVIEDAAQAQGACYNNAHAGTLGAAACFSFYPGKNLGAYGDAGAVTTDNPEIAEHIRRLRNHGRIGKYEHLEIGYGERLDTLQAAVLKVKLAHLENWNERRRQIARRYDTGLAQIPDVKTPRVNPQGIPIYHLYVIQHPMRDALAEHLKMAGIQTGVHYPIPLHLQPALKPLGHNKGDFPVTDHLADQILSLPIFPEMTDAEIDTVIEIIHTFRG